jgi:lipopolysaccharide transport system permease protein
VFILPLTNTITWIFLRSSGVVAVSETDIPYPVYVFTGTLIWSIVTESIQAPMQKVISNKSLLSKINFPREALILSSIYQSVSNAGIKILLMVIGMTFLGYNFLNAPFLLFPLAVISLVLSGTAIGLLLIPLGLLFTDIVKGLPIVLQFLMYLSPVVFAVPKSGWVATFVSYNPLTPLIVTTRAWITGNPTVFLQGFIEVCLLLPILIFVGWVVYRATMPIIIERMSS